MKYSYIFCLGGERLNNFVKGLWTKRGERDNKDRLVSKTKLLSSEMCSPANWELELPGNPLQLGKLGESNSLCKLPHSLGDLTADLSWFDSLPIVLDIT